MLNQFGFVLVAASLVDTFVVRTITVPAIAALVGKANWWPSKPPQIGPRRSASRAPAEID